MTDSPNCVVTECDLPAAPEKVWQALTEPGLLAAWLPDALGCETLEAEPHRLLSCRWRGSERDRSESIDSVVTFELSGTDSGGTHLRVVHRVLAVASRVISPQNESPRVVSLAGRRKGPVATACSYSTSPQASLRWAA